MHGATKRTFMFINFSLLLYVCNLASKSLLYSDMRYPKYLNSVTCSVILSFITIFTLCMWFPYIAIFGAIRRHFGKQMNKETKLRIHNITAKAALKFRSEAWVLKKREKQRLEAAQMKFLKHLLRITKPDKEKNRCIRQKSGARNIVKEIKQYQKKWVQHVQRMDTNRLPKRELQYKPQGRRNIGRPRKRWRDQLHLEDQGTGNTPNPSGTR